MSNKKLFLIFFAILIGFLISISLVYADMQVELKDGSAITIKPVTPPLHATTRADSAAKSM